MLSVLERLLGCAVQSLAVSSSTCSAQVCAPRGDRLLLEKEIRGKVVALIPVWALHLKPGLCDL